MSEIPKDSAATADSADSADSANQDEVTDEELADVSGGLNAFEPALDFSSGDLRSSMTGWRPRPPRGF